MLTFEESLLARFTVVFDAAGEESVTFSVAVLPSATETPDCNRIVSGGFTVTVAVVSAMLGALAWITAVPAATPVTVKLALVALAGMFTVAGTVAAAVLLELRLIVKPLGGAGDERFSVRVPLELAPMLNVLDAKLSVGALTCTGAVTGEYPGAEAVMVPVPDPTPVTCGWDAGVVEPCGITTVPGVMVAFDVSLLINVTVTAD